MGGRGGDKQRCECISTFTPSSAGTKVLPQADTRLSARKSPFSNPKLGREMQSHAHITTTTPSPTARGPAGFGAAPAPLCWAGDAGGYLTLTLSPPLHTHTVFKVSWGMFFFPSLSLRGCRRFFKCMVQCPAPAAPCPPPPAPLTRCHRFANFLLHSFPPLISPPPLPGGTHLFLYSHVLRVF